VPRYTADFELRVLEQNAEDRAALNKALSIFIKNTAQGIRTQSRQIQFKFENPNNPHGQLYYLALCLDGAVVGFAMLGYFHQRRVVVLDHMAIDAPFRKNGSFYVFASLIRQFIEDQFPEYDFAVAEIAIDADFAADDVGGKAMVRLLRHIGFGQVKVEYTIANMESRDYKQGYKGVLMLRAAKKITKIRSEDLLDIYNVILFEHYLPWFKDFFGASLETYKKHLERLFSNFQRRLAKTAMISINGAEQDELARWPTRRRKTFLGLPLKAVGHFTLFLGMLIAVSGVGITFRFDARTFLALALACVAGYAGLAALSDTNALKVFERIGAVVTKLISRK
jgi:hypothetical protein